MAITVDLTEEEEARLQEMAAIRGLPPEEHAHLLLANLLRSVPEQESVTQNEEREQLITAARAGDTTARLRLMEMTPIIPVVDPVTGKSTPEMTREMLSREYIYED